MKEKGLILKNYEMDYSFIIKNYLDPKMWQKKWNLFIYKNFVFTLRMSSIYVQEEKVNFYVRIEDILNVEDYKTEYDYTGNYCEEFVQYSLKIEDVSFLEKMINTAMINCIKKLEERKIIASDRYQEIKAGKREEENRLREIAESFLDDNKVKNEDIREAYIESYVDNNAKIEYRLAEYKKIKRYNELTDLYLIIASVNKNESLLEEVKRNSLDLDSLERIESETLEYIKRLETEEFTEEMSENLEDI